MEDQTILDTLQTLPATIVVYLAVFGIGVLLGFFIGFNVSVWFRTEKGFNKDKAMQVFIIIIVSIAWLGSVIIELIDRTFSTPFILHLIMGMLVGGVMQLDFTSVLQSAYPFKKNDKQTEKIKS